MRNIRAVFAWWQAVLVLVGLSAVAVGGSARAERLQEAPLWIEIWMAEDHECPVPVPMVQYAERGACLKGTAVIHGTEAGRAPMCGAAVTFRVRRENSDASPVAMPLQYRVENGGGKMYLALSGFAAYDVTAYPVYEIEADPFEIGDDQYMVVGILDLVFLHDGAGTIEIAGKRGENPFLAEVRPGKSVTRYLEVARTESEPHAGL